MSVLLIALLMATTALAGCHDLTNGPAPVTDTDDNGEDAAESDDTEDGTTDGETDDGEENDNGDEGNGDNGDGNGEDENTDDGDGNGDNGDNGDNGNGEDPDPVEEGDFSVDHEVVIESANGLIGGGCEEDPFEPESLEISVGEVVRWDNQGQCGHTATSDDDLWDTGNIPDGEKSGQSYRFNEPGTYSYFCKWHPGMTAEIIVS